MEMLSIKYLFEKNIVRDVSTLQLEHQKSYFLTFYDFKGKSAKIYFTQKGNIFLSQKFNKGDNISELLKDSDILQVSFENTRHEFEIYLNAVRDYSSQAELSKTFEFEKPFTENFDKKAFLKLFR